MNPWNVLGTGSFELFSANENDSFLADVIVVGFEDAEF
jgi:hypothetical protein